MKNTRVLMTLAMTFVFGLLVSSIIPGCKPPAAKKTDGAGSSNTTNSNTTTTNSNGTDAGIGLPPHGDSNTTSAPVVQSEEAVVEPASEPATDPSAEPPADEPEAEPAASAAADDEAAESVAKVELEEPTDAVLASNDVPQWGINSLRNNTPEGTNIPTDWQTGGFDRKTSEWIKDGVQDEETGEWKTPKARNIKWVSRVGSQTYGNPVVAGGRLYIGTNNSGGYLTRYPAKVDLGCLLCFDEQTGEFLWQHSSEKLSTGRVHDWPLQGICCAPLVEGNNVWFVTSRGEVRCVDAEGFYDGENDGPIVDEKGRLFDIRRNEVAEDDQVGPAIAVLNNGELNDFLREQFTRTEAELPAEVVVGPGAGENRWSIKATLGDVEREFLAMAVGPKLSVFKIITPADKHEADVIWSFDMMRELEVSQHNMCSCSVTSHGDILFVNTSNGLDESHINLPSPDAPSFIAMNKHTGEVLWTDSSPAANILHGQWSSPAVAELGGVVQVIFGGGDGWVYSFQGDEGIDGKPKLLWKFDANPKASKWILGGRGTRNNIIATPVIYKEKVYVAVGQDPEHGEGEGHLWCLDPVKKLDGSDVSAELAMKVEGDERVAIEHRRLQAVIEEEGEVAVDNPDSAVVWHYNGGDQNGDGELDFEEEMHRSCGTVAIKDDLLFIADFSGLFHCLDATTGEMHWTHDMLAAAWGSPMIVENHVYIGDEDGDVSVFNLSADPHVAMKSLPLEEGDTEEDREWVPINANEDGDVTNMDNSVYSTPIVANNVLFIANKTHVFAIAPTDEDGAE